MNSAGRSRYGRSSLVALLGALMLSAALAQQTPYPAPAPGQTYPGTPAYPAQTPAYPAQTPSYPNPSYPAPAYPAPAYPAPNPAYPSQPYPVPATGYPGSSPAYPGQPMAGYPPPAAPPQSHFFRDLFAQTIAAVLQTTSGGLLATITGRIMEWFSRKGANPAAPGAYPASGQYPQYANTAGYPPTTAPGYPNAAYPASATAGYQTPAYSAAYPATSQPAAYPTSQPGSTYPNTAQTYTPPATGTSAYAQPPTYSATQSAPAYSAAPGYPGTQAYAPPTSTQAYAPPTSTQAYAPPTGAYSTQPAVAPSAAQGYTTPTGQYPTAAQTAPMYAAAAPAQVYDARTGQLVAPDANPYATRGLAPEGTLYAGIAYEVHTQAPDGGYSVPVNTATYDFHTGDKFMVYYRPSLPGHMEIYNINAAGKQSLIDSSNMAAGQMVGLGPYQFTNDAGNETLRLVLSPCSTPQLITQTRDIVKVDAPAMPASNPAVQLGDCGAPSARGLEVHTRDIEKVAVEGTTSFALDPISHKELKSGQITPREAIIVFHHR
jgi:hypothetical protein